MTEFVSPSRPIFENHIRGCHGKPCAEKLSLKIVSNIFSAQFILIISHYKNIGYNINVLQ